MAKRYHLRTLLSLIVCFSTVAAVFPTPGEIEHLEHDVTYQPSDIDAEIVELFEGYDAPSALFAVDIYWIRYKSTYPDGTAATIRGQLFVPQIVPPTGGDEPGDGGHTGGDRSHRDLYLFGPGSTGIRDACSPSREHVLGIHWGLYRAHMLSFAGQGFVGLLPDYMGMGDPERYQPFFHADAGAYLMLDGVRAARSALNSLEEPPFDATYLVGFSQGGHAAFAAADYRERYAPDVTIDGIIGYGPTTNIVALLREFVVAAPIVAYSYRERYGRERFDPAVIFQDRWLETLDEDVTRQCIGGIQRYYPWNGEELFRPEIWDALHTDTVAAISPEIDQILKEHTVGLTGHGVPALILQGTDDIVVYTKSQSDFVVKLRERGSDVRYFIYDDVRHDVRQAAFYDVMAWIEEQ